MYDMGIKNCSISDSRLAVYKAMLIGDHVPDKKS